MYTVQHGPACWLIYRIVGQKCLRISYQMKTKHKTNKMFSFKHNQEKKKSVLLFLDEIINVSKINL